MVAGRGDEELVLDIYIMLCLTNQLRIGVLNAVFSEDSARPVRAASYNLGVYCALFVSESFRAQRGGWLVDVIANGVYGLWTPTRSSSRPSRPPSKPVKPTISFVLVSV